MHISSYKRMKFLLEWYKPYWDRNCDRVDILDIGSYDQNGTNKTLFDDKRYFYNGLDMVEGPNVDIVPNDIYKWTELEDNKFDLVVSGQVFEHVEYPWLTINEIARILKPGGFLILIAPNSGFEHKAPYDCYRYYSDGLAALAKWANLYVHHTSVAGVPDVSADNEWVSEWNDAVLVAQKKPVSSINISIPFKYEKRMSGKECCDLKYLNEKVAIEDFLIKYSDKKFILFGAGIIGERICSLLGEEKVFCFADNNVAKIGKKLQGKKIYSLEEIKKIHDEYYILVTVKDCLASQIHKQLKQHGIQSIDIYKVVV